MLIGAMFLTTTIDDVIIIGAGVSGLAAANFLHTENVKIKMLEAKGRLLCFFVLVAKILFSVITTKKKVVFRICSQDNKGNKRNKIMLKDIHLGIIPNTVSIQFQEIVSKMTDFLVKNGCSIASCSRDNLICKNNFKKPDWL